MKFLKQTSCWLGVVPIVGMTAAFMLNSHLDPTDDFSFMLSKASARTSYGIMSEKQVVAVLRDRLDLFPKSQTTKLAKHINNLCAKYRFDPAFILSLIEVESTFRVKAVSSAGAVGLMQLQPGTARVVAKKFGIKYTGDRSLRDPFTNVSLGIAYLYLLREKYQGFSPYFHVAAYNIGPGRMDELLSRGGFRPTKTKKYYQMIRNGVPALRDYRSAGGQRRV